jgi:hypothetical protein
MALPVRLYCNFDRVNSHQYKINKDKEKWRQNIRSIISVIPHSTAKGRHSSIH